MAVARGARGSGYGTPYWLVRLKISEADIQWVGMEEDGDHYNVFQTKDGDKAYGFDAREEAFQAASGYDCREVSVVKVD